MGECGRHLLELVVEQIPRFFPRPRIDRECGDHGAQREAYEQPKQ
jgi:hypothetical protein